MPLRRLEDEPECSSPEHYPPREYLFSLPPGTYEYECPQCQAKFVFVVDVDSPIMTEAQKEEQRRNFAFGNASFGNSKITRELVGAVAEKMAKEKAAKSEAVTSKLAPPTTLGEALPIEMARVRDKVMPAYREIGPSGIFALNFMQQDLDRAARAMAEGDVAAMLGCLQKLREYSV